MMFGRCPSAAELLLSDPFKGGPPSDYSEAKSFKSTQTALWLEGWLHLVRHNPPKKMTKNPINKKSVKSESSNTEEEHHFEALSKLREDPEFKSIEESALNSLKNVKAIGRKTIKEARDLGRELRRLKEKIPHGGWETYLRSELDLSPRTACIYLKLWEETKDEEEWEAFFKSAKIADLGITKFLKKFSKERENEQKKDSKKQSIEARKASTSVINLADGSSVPFPKKNDEKQLIDPEYISRHYETVAHESGSQDARSEARQQRITLKILDAINESAPAIPEATNTVIGALDEAKAIFVEQIELTTQA